MEHLLPRFVEAARTAGATASAVELEGAGMDLLRRWAEPHRGYHDVLHLAEVLDRLDDLSRDGEPVPVEAVLAAWFHDAVYTGAPGDDERASAELATSELRALGVPERVCDAVEALVLVTAGHRPAAGDPAAGALCDADLAVLASATERYEAYVAGVRREHAHVADDAFAAGRAAVLRDLLARPTLFTTAAGRRRWEAPARTNLATELRSLEGLGGLKGP
ncbi:MAG: metal-dependent phosphohydrolase [Actinomycetes bacterium]